MSPPSDEPEEDKILITPPVLEILPEPAKLVEALKQTPDAKDLSDVRTRLSEITSMLEESVPLPPHPTEEEREVHAQGQKPATLPPRPSVEPIGTVEELNPPAPTSPNIRMIPDVYDQMWLGIRTMLAMKFYEHDLDEPTIEGHLGASHSWNSLEEADKTKYLKMAQDVMSNGTHDVVYGEAVRRRANTQRMGNIAMNALASKVVSAVADLIPPSSDTPPKDPDAT